MEERGFVCVSKDRVTSLDAKGHKGIDGVYYNKHTDTHVVAEAKYNTAKLGMTNDGQQMSHEWIENRLPKAVNEDTISNIDIRGGYQRELVRVMPDGSIKHKILKD